MDEKMVAVFTIIRPSRKKIDVREKVGWYGI